MTTRPDGDQVAAEVAADIAIGRRPSVVLSRATDYLARHGVDPARETAELLLASVLGADRATLFTSSEALDAEQARRFGQMLCVRCAGTPTQHLTGEQGFRHLVLTVRPGVLVPRPETEIVVDVVLDAVGRYRDPKIVVDIGTGSGAIAVSVASEREGMKVYATDVSAEAVALAEENARRVGVDVWIGCGDLFSPLPDELRGTVGVVVSNPPYLTEVEYDAVPIEVAADPREALVGGTTLHERVAKEASEWLVEGGTLVLEIGSTQAAEVSDILGQHGFEDVQVVQDLAGRDRVVTGIAG